MIETVDAGHARIVLATGNRETTFPGRKNSSNIAGFRRLYPRNFCKSNTASPPISNTKATS